MPTSADTFFTVMQLAAILLELGGAVLIALLFWLMRRHALHRAYFATWSSAWLAMVVAIAAVGTRYNFLEGLAGATLADNALPVRALYLLYQCGKLLFWLLVWRGVVEYAYPGRTVPRWAIAAALIYAALSVTQSHGLDAIVAWQAPVAVACCVAGALALFELPVGRRSIGSMATGTVLGLSALLWTVYFVVFAGAAGMLPGASGLAGTVTRYNSYVDVLMIVMLGYAMIVLFMEDARLRLSESEARLAALVSSSADAIVTTDVALQLLDVNVAAERLFGVRRASVVGRGVEELVVPDDRTRFRGALMSFIASDATTLVVDADEEVRAFRADRPPVALEVAASKLRANATLSLALVLRDVTQRREAEEKKRQTHKMDAVRQLAGGLAHDFNNLLTAIVGRSQIIRGALPSGSPLRDGVDEIAGTANAAARLTRGLLALSLREPLKPERLPLNAVVRSLERKIRVTAGPLVAMEFRFAEDAGDVHVDPVRLHDVVLAVTQNAREAIGAGGGRIAVETSRVTWQRELGHTLEAACISVRDSGPGFASDARAHLFEPFFSTKGDGRGLGLATAYAFLHQSGGWIDVQNGNTGTTVRMALPVMQHAADPAAAPQAPAVAPRSPPDPTVPRTVLVAEDEASVRRFVRTVLEREGFRVLDAENGMDAMQVFEAANPPVDVLLTDVAMPLMGGRELAERLVAANPSLRVIFMSGYVSDGDLLAGLNDRRAPFLQKPFDIDELARVVRHEVTS